MARPRNNLSPQAQDYLRSLEKDIDELKRLAGAIEAKTSHPANIMIKNVDAATLTGQITGSEQIKENTITAGLLEEVLVLATNIIAGNPEGARIELTPTTFRMYDASENVLIDFDPTGGAVFRGTVEGSEIVGSTFKTDTTGNRIEIKEDTIPDAGVAGGIIEFYTGDSLERYKGYLDSFADDSTNYVTGELHLSPPKFTPNGNSLLWLWNRASKIADPSEDFSAAWLAADYITIGDTGTRLITIGGYQAEITTYGKEDGRYGSWYYPKHSIFLVDSNQTLTTDEIPLNWLVTYYSPTADNPLFIWDVSATAGENLQYTTNGTTWTVIGGDTGWPPFADPGADRIVFWDDSANTWAALAPSTGLVISGTDLSVRAASETQTGIVELGTDAETVTGTSTTLATHPSGVHAAIAAANLSGTYASRPAASSVPNPTLYYATDVPEAYRSDGTAWTVVGTDAELGYAEITNQFDTTSATGVDVTGLSITATFGERPVKAIFDGTLRNSADQYARIWIVVDGVQVAIGGGLTSGYRATQRAYVIRGLTPGTSHTVKIQLGAPTGGTASVVGDPNNPSFIQLVTQ